MSTQIKGNQILDGTIDLPDLSEGAKAEFSKIKSSQNDPTSGYLIDKLVAGNGVHLALSGSSGSFQTVVVSSTTSGSSDSALWYLDQDGIIHASSSIEVDGNLLNIMGDLDVTGSSFFNGPVNISGSFATSGSVEFEGTGLEVTGSLHVLGNSELSGTFKVSGQTEFDCNVIELTGSMNVNGIVDVTGSLTVNGLELNSPWKTLWSYSANNDQNFSWSSGSTQKVSGSNSEAQVVVNSSGCTVSIGSSGMQISYPGSGLSGSFANFGLSLSAWGLSGLGGAPWRMWLHFTPSGGISSGMDALKFYIDLSGSASTSSDGMPEKFSMPFERDSYQGGYCEFLSTNVGTNPLSSDQAWSAFDVLCIEQTGGSVVAKLGTYSSGWPSEDQMHPFAHGAIPQQLGPYQLDSSFVVRAGAEGASPGFTSRAWIFPHMLLQRM